MKRIFKLGMPLFLMMVLFGMLSCSNKVAKNTYKCEIDERVSIEFKKGDDAVIFYELEVQKDDPTTEYETKKIQAAIGTYRIKDNLIIFTVGNQNALLNAIIPAKVKDGKVPKALYPIQNSFSFIIQDSGAKLTCNVDGSTWKK